MKGPAVKARAPTPELPTVPCLPPSLLGSLQPEPLACTDTEAEAEENQEEVEEDIREYNRSVAEAIQTMVATITNTLREERDEVGELPPALLTPDTDTFTIPASSCPKYINIHFIGEISSRILFSTISWLRQLPFFSSLKQSNQKKVNSKLFSRRNVQSSEQVTRHHLEVEYENEEYSFYWIVIVATGLGK